MVGGVIMPKINLDNTLYLQVRLAHKYMKRHNISIEQFRQQDREYDILGFLEEGYEPYHLTGDEGVLDEIDAIVAGQQVVKDSTATPSAGNP
jgi:hypothetical protein